MNSEIFLVTVFLINLRQKPMVPMGSYSPGDVLLIPIDLRGKRGKKARPALVVGADSPSVLLVCPISGHASGDSSSLPLELEDFEEGGLDLFSASYILVSITCRVPVSDVFGKKGRLSMEFLERISPLRKNTRT
jgi:mRNA-degrading endonuclease toxin of MazEF toxin-antitoxin module